MTKNPEYLLVEPPKDADACVIWLHGLGADGNDFAGIVSELGLPDDHGVRFIFPNAPFINVTVNNGMRMRGWYDIYDLSMLRDEDVAGIKSSHQIIDKIISQQINAGIASQRIMLAGFSQGGAMSLYSMLRYPQILGGAIVLSAYMLLASSLTSEQTEENRTTPIFMAHGMFDPIVPYLLGQQAHAMLQQNGNPIEWHSYPMVHTVCLEEIAAIGLFLRRCLNYA